MHWRVVAEVFGDNMASTIADPLPQKQMFSFNSFCFHYLGPSEKLKFYEGANFLLILHTIHLPIMNAVPIKSSNYRTSYRF